MISTRPPFALSLSKGDLGLFTSASIADLKNKWGMGFNEFKEKLKGRELEKGGYSYDVEKDFWKWEEAETLKMHYEEMRDKWI